MRALKKQSTSFKPNCVICKKKTCVDDVPKIKCRITPDSSRVTRSVTRLIESMNDFIIYEIYRCMPLLGNEDQLEPHWDVHIVHYSLVFNEITRVQYNYN